MTSLAPGDVVWVPYPFVESEERKSRPALVVATRLGPNADLFWAVMITSAQRAPWPGDVLVANHEKVGLPVPSRIRTHKLATLPAALANFVGRVSPEQLSAVHALLTGTIGPLRTGD